MKIVNGERAQRQAVDALKEALMKKGPLLFLTSGGSCLKLLDDKLVPSDASRWTISVLDEHYVQSAGDRNFSKLMQLPFFGAAQDRGASSCDPYGGPVEEAGKRFNAFLKRWLLAHPTGRVVTTVGIGADAHTMGIVPFDDPKKFERLFNDAGALAVGYETEYGDYPARVTSTFPLLQRADDVIIFAIGDEKREAVKQLLSSDADASAYPAAALRDLTNASLYTDAPIAA